ncbi:endothelial PAS domain-containing protein 1 isoform X2 [Syngnathoides biaculeatus]|uniref:endothelial PAS domain-containing protein 1 isoform X2 n=1 Tax=Syngnathoides biaculeatus TaxID=300417 RepID=UPI002ADD76E4|nr:endothelial PAS domain-containing protein 1 isoform X2 [Syngnathoides biaculeatus]
MKVDKERRRAISREAARKRRRAEADVFADLLRLLPLRASVRAQLDKPSVIRLALCYVRLKTLLRDAMFASPFFTGAAELRQNSESETEAVDETDVYLRVLEGFVMVLSSEGDMMFLSDNVGRYLGLTQTELMGHNIFEFTHPCDHEEIRSVLHFSAGEPWSDAKCDFVMRIKSTLTPRGRSTNLKSATWKVLHCQGRAATCADPFLTSCLLLTCRPLPVSHTLLCSRTFSSEHSMDMRFTHCDHRVTSILGYPPHELVGRSIYELCHTLDVVCLRKYHIDLYSKSQSVSGRYRMLARGGGYVWAESHSAAVPGPRAPKSRAGHPQPRLILSVTYVLSVEEAFLQLSLEQKMQHGYVSRG